MAPSFRAYAILVALILCYVSCVSSQSIPYWGDEEETMSLYHPVEMYTDDDYNEFDVFGVGDEDTTGLMMNQYAQPMENWQSQMGKHYAQQPVRLGMIYQTLNPETNADQYLQDQVENVYKDETIVKPRVMNEKPVIVPRYQKQPITRIHPVTQPLVRRVVRQKVIRPHIIERVEVRPRILEQPVIVPRYYDQVKRHQTFREEHVEGSPIRLQPTYQREKIRAAPTYGSLPPRYEQPTKQQYQSFQSTKGQYNVPNF